MLKSLAENLVSAMLGNPIVVFMLAMFVAVVIWQIDAMASFTEAIYAALVTSFSILPIIAIVGALAFLVVIPAKRS